MINLFSMKCPDCGAELSVERDREFLFCQYCGAKILVNDENTFTVRHVDEAELKKAETEHMVQMNEIKSERKLQGRDRLLFYVWIIATAALGIPGIIAMLADDEGLAGMFLLILALNVGLAGGTYFFNERKKDKRRTVSGAGIKISHNIAEYHNKHYEAIISLLKRAGFSDIKTVALKDLNFLTSIKNGRVKSIIIDGYDKIEAGDIFSKDAAITVIYHSMP